MHLHSHVDRVGVAAADHDGDRKANLAALLEHERVAPREAVERERESSESVAFVRICSRDVHDEIGLPPRQ